MRDPDPVMPASFQRSASGSVSKRFIDGHWKSRMKPYFILPKVPAMQPAEKLSITLPAEMARLVREKVSSGAYGSASEVIRTALRGWMEDEKRLKVLDDAIAEGIADAKAGRVQSIDEVRAILRAAKEASA